MKHLAVMAAILLGTAAAADNPDRTKVAGSWQTPGEAETREIWNLGFDGDAVRIQRTLTGSKSSEIRCNTRGRECESRSGKQPVKVSIWFNGPKLVVMETRGSEVIKRRFHASEDGSALEMEVIPIVPRGDPRTIRLTRIAESQ